MGRKNLLNIKHSGRIAVEQIKDLKEVYLIGHDLESYNRLVNNIYKGTRHYVAEQNGKTHQKTGKYNGVQFVYRI